MVSRRKKVIDPVRRSNPGLLNVDQTRETVGLLAWTVDGRFPTLQDSPKENKLTQTCEMIYDGQTPEWPGMVGAAL